MGKEETAIDTSKAIEAAVANIEKAHGKGSIFKLSSRSALGVPVIPTGIFELDHVVIGAGGFPRNRITEVYGGEASGKTTLTLRAIAEAQKTGGVAAIVDIENALDSSWCTKNGVVIDDLYVAQPSSGEEALQIVEELINSKGFDLIVVDSVAALVPQAELDGEVGQSHMGLQARMMSQAMRRLTGILSKSNSALVFINQTRSNLGVTYGPTTTTSGGRALRFYASLRLELSRISSIKVGDDTVGNHVKIKGTKNKLAAPFRECVVDLMFDSGFDGVGSLFDCAVNAKIITKAGSWFSIGDMKLGQGKGTAIATLNQNNMMEKILKETLCKI